MRPVKTSVSKMGLTLVSALLALLLANAAFAQPVDDVAEEVPEEAGDAEDEATPGDLGEAPKPSKPAPDDPTVPPQAVEPLPGQIQATDKETNCTDRIPIHQSGKPWVRWRTK